MSQSITPAWADRFGLHRPEGMEYNVKVPDGFGYVLLVFDRKMVEGPAPTEMCTSNVDKDSAAELVAVIRGWLNRFETSLQIERKKRENRGGQAVG
jgi:hypothetical protein